jgi:hypothetical protein
VWMHSSPREFASGDDVLPRATTGAPSSGYQADTAHAELLRHLNPRAV